MTEAEWLVCNEPTAMLGSLRCPVSERKLHLFACGCCRAVWECIPLGLHRKLVDVAEQCADGRLGHGILELVEKRARAQSALPNEAIHGAFAALAVTNVIGWWAASRTLLAAREAVCKWAVTVASTGELHPTSAVATAAVRAWGTEWARRNAEPAWSWNNIWPEAAQAAGDAAHAAAEQMFANVLRCLFCNSFRPTSFEPAWLTPTVLALTAQMYDSRDFGAMPILADALQEAGCDNDDVLCHCRDTSTPHARGCWVVDAVLSKE